MDGVESTKVDTVIAATEDKYVLEKVKISVVSDPDKAAGWPRT